MDEGEYPHTGEGVDSSDDEEGTTTSHNGTTNEKKEDLLKEGGEGEEEENTTAIAGVVVAPDISLTVKHPLQNRWALWYDCPGKKTNMSSWGDYLKKITSFDTVEDFWRVFNNIKPPSVLSSGSNYHLFKDHIEPKWEDQLNSRGGKWTILLPKNRKELVDQAWLYAILACIGESFDFADEVCGIVVSIRKPQDKFAIWTKDWRNENNVLSLGRQLKGMLELPENISMGYLSHEDSLKMRTSKNRYEI